MLFSGAIMALGLLARMHGEPGMAADIVQEMELEECDLSSLGLSEFDQENISLLNKEGLKIKA